MRNHNEEMRESDEGPGEHDTPHNRPEFPHGKPVYMRRNGRGPKRIVGYTKSVFEREFKPVFKKEA